MTRSCYSVLTISAINHNETDDLNTSRYSNHAIGCDIRTLCCKQQHTIQKFVVFFLFWRKISLLRKFQFKIIRMFICLNHALHVANEGNQTLWWHDKYFCYSTPNVQRSNRARTLLRIHFNEYFKFRTSAFLNWHLNFR